MLTSHDCVFLQNLSCSSCGEPPEAHMYSYTHRNENLIVLVRHLLPKYCLPGELEGKICMWTRCLRCERESGVPRSSRRVIMSAEAHYLSFGKFLELSFSSHSTARRLPICGHSLNTDCLRFFWVGIQSCNVPVFLSRNLQCLQTTAYSWDSQSRYAQRCPKVAALVFRALIVESSMRADYFLC